MSFHFSSSCPFLALSPFLHLGLSLVLVPCPKYGSHGFPSRSNLSLAHGFRVPIGVSPSSDLQSTSLFHTLSPLTLGTAVSRSPFRPFQSKGLLSVRDLTGPRSATVCTHHTYGHHPSATGAHVMRGPAKDLPSRIMRAVAGLSREQNLDLQGAIRAWPLLCTHCQGYLVNSITHRASRWIIQGI